MRQALNQKSAAASPARVQFEVITNPNVGESIPSADDWSFDQIAPSRDHPDRDLLWFKPGAYYWRKAIRESYGATELVQHVRALVGEIEALAMWATHWSPGGVSHLVHARLALVAVEKAYRRLDECSMRSAGLELCGCLEKLQDWIGSDLWLIPPRFVATQLEVADKRRTCWRKMEVCHA